MTTISGERTASSAQYLLDGLVESGVEYVFCNFGTDHVSLIEALAVAQREGRPLPTIIACPHENVAVHMAAGYASVTGRGQAVVVHVDAGTANAAMGLHNLFRSRLPVMLLAGKAPFTVRGELEGSRDNYVHFVQDPFDIASLVRPYVKWEYSLQTGVVAKEVVRRAHAVMQSDPPGPVYLTLPRETLAQQWPASRVHGFSAERYGPVALRGVDDAQVQAIARQLMQAQQPVAFTSYIGRKAEAVQALQELAELAGIRVVQYSPIHMNLPRSSPCFAGFDPVALHAQADLGLLLDVDVPWLPKYVADRPQARWIHVDIDPIKKDCPLWGFATDVRLQADCATVLRQVTQAVRAQADAGFHARVKERIASWQPQNREREQAAARAAAMPGKTGALTPASVCAALGRAIGDDDIVINEAVRNQPAVFQHIPRNRPLTLFGSAGGGLGYSGGMALGAKLARPDARVIHIVGDGGFHFNTPSSLYAVAQRHGLPILTVVLDNGGWLAVKEAVLRVYPDGEAAQQNEFHARLQGEERRFEQVGQAFGAWGECVTEPDQLEGAITRALQALDSGRAAVLNVQVGLQ